MKAYEFVETAELKGVRVKQEAEDVLHVHVLCLVDDVHELQYGYPKRQKRLEKSCAIC